jgi:long-chain fatty acid transport protein
MITGGLQVMDGSIDYQLNNDAQRSPGDVMKTVPNASAFYSQKMTDDLYAGIGLYGNYGGDRLR